MIVRLRNPLTAEQLAPFQLSVVGPPWPYDFSEVFGNDHPVEMEIGHGKGWFVVASGMGRPDVNLVGVEVARKRHLFTVNRVAKRKLANVRLICARAQDVLKEWIQPESLRAIHIYFPDPWWKRRHEKRAVVTSDFVESCLRALPRGGFVHTASDVPSRFESIRELFLSSPRFAERGDAPQRALPQVISNFEAHAREAGRGIQRTSFERIT